MQAKSTSGHMKHVFQIEENRLKRLSANDTLHKFHKSSELCMSLSHLLTS